MTVNKYVRIITIPCFLFILLCLNIHVYANDQVLVKVGYIKDYGFIDDEYGYPKSGYCHNYLNKIATYTGWKYEFVPVEWSEGIEKLASGEIDLFGPIQKNEYFENIFDYHDIEMGFEYGALYINSGNAAIYYDDVKAFDGIKVGTEKNSSYNAYMDEYCKNNGISVEYVYTDMSNFDKGLENGEFDAFLSGSLMHIDNSTVVAKISTEPYYYPTTKGNKAIVDGMNMGLKSILGEDIYYTSKLYEKYYKDKSINMPKFTKEELDFIKSHKVLNVVCDPSWTPLEYYSDNTNTYKGINIDILHEIGKNCGIEFNYIKVSDYEESKAMIKDGRADLLMGYSRLETDILGVEYTNPFLEIPVVLVGRSDIDFTDNLDIAMRKLDSPLALKIIDQYPEYTYVDGYDTSKDIITAVTNKKADAVFISAYVFDEMLRNGSYEKFITIHTKINFPQCIGVSNSLGNIAISIFNKAINRLTPEQISSIVLSNTINRAYSIPLTKIIKENTFLIILILTTFFTIILFINKRNSNALKKIAYVDSLTNLPTITKFKLDVEDILKSAYPSQYMIMSVDIDNFKYINNSFGYSIGNKILVSLAQNFLKNIKEGERIGRNSADNFVFLRKIIQNDELDEFRKIINNIIEQLQDILPQHYNITICVGVYTIQNVNEDLSVIIDKANFARKSIKGHNAVDYAEYTADMDKQVEWKKEVTISMEDALQNKEFEFYLQPKYLLKGEILVGAEALIRWNHPKKGLLSPYSFVPIFEQNGFITKIDLFVFEEVCALLKKWEKDKIENIHITISINLSRLHFHNRHLVEDLIEITDKYSVPKEYIEIELTESIVFHNTSLLIQIMSKLREAGFKISIDDFGSSYSSLNMLKDLPVDILKIDKEFLNESASVLNGQIIIEAVTRMAKNLKLVTVAEGVETSEQAQMLLNMDCDIAQGYYYAKPMPISEFEKLL